MKFWDVIENRHSVRDFLPEPIPREIVERVMYAASRAPSSMNSQPWTYYCCRGESRSALGKIVAQCTVHLSEYMEMLGPKGYEDAMEWYSSLGDAPVLLALASPDAEDAFALLNRNISLGASIENLLLAATAEGLAACNVTFSMWVKDEMAELLGVPDDQSVIAIIALGYPGPVPQISPPKRGDIAVWLD